ncbi:hypothetical protein HWV62_14510 [Athelia sp. TMB]|nr:hypothetical protein HWV62_26833 [Athelia sp. TMB]KAF7984436.1 hypothetical protein HWV62_14510 [Athelia sp. TMB]
MSQLISSSKRKRDDNSLDITRSDIWFEDGNIVLQAESTQFKVYRGMLSRHSSVFRDMLTVPQPPTHQDDLVEGCVVVELSDSSEDLTHVFKALCDRECVDFKLTSWLAD